MAYRPKIKNANGTLTDLPLEAETAVKLKTARTIGLSGVSATAKSFDGTGNVTIPITGIPASLITGELVAKSAEKALKEADGTYTALVVDSNGYIKAGDRIVISKTPLYVATVGTYTADYTILSGDTFPTVGKSYEVIYQDNGINQSFKIKFPAKGNTSYVNLCFSLMFNTAKSSNDVTISTSSDKTYKYISWKIDHTNQKVMQTKVSGGQCAATTVYFKGIYELHEEFGAK